MNLRSLIAALVISTCLLPIFGDAEKSPKETPHPTARYIRDTWGTDEGLPQSSVTSIVQTRDGYLWLGTSGGLARFDGVSFTVFDAGNTNGLKGNRITSLYEDREGVLWAGTEGSGLIRYAGGQFMTYTTKDGLPSDNTGSIYQDRRGDCWVGTDKGLVRIRDGAFTTLTEKDGLPHIAVSHVIEDRAGTLWVGTSRGLVRFENDQPTTFNVGDGLPHEFIANFCETRDGSLWVATLQGVARFRAGRVATYPIKDTFVRCLYEDGDGRLWAGTNKGLLTFHGEKFTPYSAGEELSGSDVMSVAGDREGNVWVGTNTGGLNRLKAAKLTVFGKKQGLPQENMVPITEDAGGNVWMGLTCGGLVKYHDGEFTTYTERDGLRNDCVWSLLADPDGTLWVGTWDGGLGRYRDGRFEFYTNENSRLSNNVVLALYRDRRGALWVGTGDGLNKFENGEFTAYGKQDGLVSGDVRFITEDRQGALWIGTYGGLSRFENGKFTNYTTESGLSHNFVRAVYEDGDGGLWIGTYGGGLNRLKNGSFTHYGRENGLFDDVVSRILEDPRGNLWMSGNRGIFRVSRAELNDFAAGEINFVNSISLDASDGMENRECNGGGQPAGWKTRDGRLWFPTIKGAVVLDPERTKANELPPPVVIEHALANREAVDHPAKIELPPGNSDLEVRYTGLSFVAPEKVRFKYRLEGYDDDWVEAGARRVAYYTNLPPGNFRFHVIASNNDGVWNTEGATLEVVVVPPFWKTWWFTILSTLGVVAVTYAAYRFRIARLRRTQEAQAAFSRQLIQSQENERKRIAAELHDSLGQNLLVIKNRALLGLSSGENHAKAAEQFNEITSSATEALNEVREISYNLRPYHLDRLGLTAALEAMIEKIADASRINFSSDIDRLDGLFSQEAEINFYRIVQECVNNVVKHSGATRARVKVVREARAVRLTVEDDGRGFTPEATGFSQGGFGLTGIAERVRILGGTQTTQSAPGKGTITTIKIDLPGES